MNTLKYALRYAELGLGVIPIKKAGKQPLIEWKEYQTRRATNEEIKAWEKRWPEANIGIVTGAVSGIIVLDVDGEPGKQTLVEGRYHLPPTWTVATGGGGIHYYYRQPGFPVGNAVRLLPGLDVRGDGGYVVAPPSLHKSGNRYEWTLNPADTDLAEAPEWLLTLLRRQSAGGKVQPEEWEATLTEGQRNEELTRRAGSLLRRMPAGEAQTMLQAWNLKHCQPPLAEAEVRTIIESIAKREAAKPKIEEAPEEEKKESQADALIRISTTEAFLFHDEVKDGFAVIPISKHKETWPLHSKFFKQWLVRRYYEQTDKSPNNEAIRQALNVIEAKAMFDGKEIKLNLRVAESDGAFWYDLADEAWRAVRITSAGWKVVDNPPTLFRRFKNTIRQVCPKPGKLDLLKKYINLKDDKDWLLLTALVVHLFIPGVPHAIPVFYGDKGAAKTTAQRVIRKLIDPAIRDTMTLPGDKNELALLLMTNYAPCFDNLDCLSPWQSDMLCQAATGGGISKRELYTDMEEVILSFQRCPMLNGINLVASRDDLLDRSVLFKLERIDEEERKTENEFWHEFEEDRPYILGAIFDALAKAMAIYPTVHLPASPRMADFATWGYAIMEAAGGMGEAFLKAYRKNIAGAVEEAVTNDIVGAAIVEFMSGTVAWQGTSSELLDALGELSCVNTKEKVWPKRPNTLTRRLNRIKSALADYGIKVNTDYRTATQRLILLEREEKISSLPSCRHKTRNIKALDDDDIMTINDGNEKIPSSPEPLINLGYDGNDANDAIFSTSLKGDKVEEKKNSVQKNKMKEVF